MTGMSIQKVTSVPETIAPGVMYLVKPLGSQKIAVYFSDKTGESKYKIDSVTEADVTVLIGEMLNSPNGIAGLVDGVIPLDKIPAVLTGKTLKNTTVEGGFTKKVYTVTGTAPVITPMNNPVQKWVLTGNSTPQLGAWEECQAIELAIDDGNSFLVDWSSMNVSWVTDNGNSPVLNANTFTFIRLWKFEETIYGERVGNR